MIEGIKNLPKDVQIIEQKIFNDNRGFLNCIYEEQNEIKLSGFSSKISSSKPNVARGMHWQNNLSPQIKVITVFEGSIMDFLINLDKDSPHFGNFYYFKLKASDNKTIIIPENYGHGFLALEKVKFFYNCFGKYSPSNEISINIVDLILKHTNLETDKIILSNKDYEAVTFTDWKKTL